MDFEKVALLIYFFVQLNVMLVLAGALLSEYFTRTKKSRAGILPFISLAFGGLVITTVDILRVFFGYKIIFLLALILLYTAILPIFVYTCTKFWSLIHKVLFSVVLLFGSLSMIFYAVEFFTNISDFLDIIFMTSTYFGAYFLIIDYLIKTSGGYRTIRSSKS